MVRLSQNQKSLLKNKGLLYVILWSIRLVVGVFAGAVFFNQNWFCQFLEIGCIAPSIGLIEVVGFGIIIVTGITITIGGTKSSLAIKGAVVWVGLMLILDLIGLLIDPVNVVKVVFDLTVIYVLVKK